MRALVCLLDIALHGKLQARPLRREPVVCAVTVPPARGVTQARLALSIRDRATIRNDWTSALGHERPSKSIEVVSAVLLKADLNSRTA